MTSPIKLLFFLLIIVRLTIITIVPVSDIIPMWLVKLTEDRLPFSSLKHAFDHIFLNHNTQLNIYLQFFMVGNNILIFGDQSRTKSWHISPDQTPSNT